MACFVLHFLAIATIIRCFFLLWWQSAGGIAVCCIFSAITILLFLFCQKMFLSDWLVLHSFFFTLVHRKNAASVGKRKEEKENLRFCSFSFFCIVNLYFSSFERKTNEKKENTNANEAVARTKCAYSKWQRWYWKTVEFIDIVLIENKC